MPWIAACPADEIEKEVVMRWEHSGRSHVAFCCPDGAFFFTDGLCATRAETGQVKVQVA